MSLGLMNACLEASEVPDDDQCLSVADLDLARPDCGLAIASIQQWRPIIWNGIVFVQEVTK